MAHSVHWLQAGPTNGALSLFPHARLWSAAKGCNDMDHSLLMGQFWSIQAHIQTPSVSVFEVGQQQASNWGTTHIIWLTFIATFLRCAIWKSCSPVLWKPHEISRQQQFLSCVSCVISCLGREYWEAHWLRRFGTC